MLRLPRRHCLHGRKKTRPTNEQPANLEVAPMTETLLRSGESAIGQASVAIGQASVMSAAIHRLQSDLGQTTSPKEEWRTLLEEVRISSERIEREIRSLRENRELLLAIIDLIPVAFFVKDHQSRFFLMNRACEEQWGMSFADLRDTDASQIFPPDQMKHFLAADRSIFEGRKPVEFEETFWSAAKQENRTGYTFKRPMYDADGNPQYLVCVTLDITDRKRAEEQILESKATIQGLVEQGLSGVYIADHEGGMVYVNPKFATMMGYQVPTDYIGRPLVDFIPDADKPGVFDAMAGLLTGKVATVSLSASVLSKQGSKIDVLAQSSLTTFRGKPAIVGVVLDITERKRSEDALRYAHTLLMTAMETSPDAILVVDEHARVTSSNQRFSDMWKIPDKVLGSGDDTQVLAAVTAVVKDRAAFLTRVRHLYAHPEEAGHDELATIDGRFIERHTAAMRTAEGKYLGRVWFFRDITDRKKVEAEVRHAARHDVLTGLANRGAFIEAVDKVIARTERGEKGFAVLYLDLDHFKDVNDTLGHPMGDDLLCAVADRLRRNVRETDVVARFGGDEFAVIAASIDEPADAANLAVKLVTALGNPYSIQGNEIRCGVSIGIAVYEGGKPELLLSQADVALYQAKSDGRGGYRFFTEAMDTEVRTRVTLSAELREAIASGQLFLEYQPQIDAETGDIIGVEALARWRHPRRGVLSPGEFIPVAETTGLIVPLDRWAKREACRQGKAWLDDGIPPIIISVNVSGAQFKRAIELEKDVAVVLAGSGLPPQLLELELTETVLMEASREHNDVLVRLRQSGVRLAIDDFGTGYSSLDYLRRFPVDRVKIAQEFVRLIASDPGSAAVVKATIGLASELGMVAIAEGVETVEQFDLLKAWGCRQMQGYYFARPLAPEELSTLLRRRILPGRPRIISDAAA
jgi:diguanylate cyclase (GGDEF)-like protein/PAS domain S-box-containing protein